MNPKRVLILSPHPDDAEYGCGGLIDKLNDGHTEFGWVVFSSCNESLPEGFPKDTALREHIQVMASMGLRSSIYDIPVRQFPEHRQKVLDIMITVKGWLNPELVICPSLGDLHQDHRTVAEEAVRAFKTSASIIGYELPADHLTFNPTMFVELSESNLSRKWDMFAYYKSQMVKDRTWNNFDFIKSMAMYRGSATGVKYAEGYEVYRWRA